MDAKHLTFSEAAPLLNRSAERVRVYAKDGARQPDGRIVVLGSIKIGCQSFTTPELIEQFLKECNPGMEALVSSRRTSDAELARQRLFERGVYGSKKRRQVRHPRM